MPHSPNELPALAAGLPLFGKRVDVSVFGPADITDAYIGWLNDPDVVRFSNQRFRRHTRETCTRYLESFAGSDNLFLSVRLRGAAAVGTMTVYYSRLHRTADVGIMIGERSVWGQGLGQDAWTSVVDWLASSRAVRKVTAGALATNVGMVRLMERSGMAFEGRRIRQEIVEGEEVDILYYARFHDA
jgi:ribosomal-protein-alanine N-acetyltransferase